MKSIYLIVLIAILKFNANAQNQSIVIGKFKYDDNAKSKSTIVYQKGSIIYFKSDFDLDADGSPFAYNPQNTGLINNSNATNSKGKLSAEIIFHLGGQPFIQGQFDSAPGYFLSLTSLQLHAYKEMDTRRYVNPDSINYFVLPGNQFKKHGVKLGDIALVYNTITKQYSYAIFADSGPVNIIGEGSTSLAKAICIRNIIDNKGRLRGGIDSGDILFIVFPNSGKGANGYDTINNDLVYELGKKAIEKLGTEESLIQNVLNNYN